jgi:hypothetical protein
MVTAFVIDMALVLYIELSRHAIEAAADAVVEVVSSGGRPLLAFHVTISTGVIILYIAMFVLGRKLLKGNESIRKTHRNAAVAFCVLRGINYVTSFIV